MILASLFIRYKGAQLSDKEQRELEKIAEQYGPTTQLDNYKFYSFDALTFALGCLKN